MIFKPLILAGFAATLAAAPVFAQSQTTTNPANSGSMSNSAPASKAGAGYNQPQNTPAPRANGGVESPTPSMPTNAQSQNGTMSNMKGQNMNGSGMASDQKAMKSKTGKSASTRHSMKNAKNNCYDLAWQSKEMNDCLARNPGQQQAGGSQFDKAAPYGTTNQGGGTGTMGGGSGANRATPKPASGNN